MKGGAARGTKRSKVTISNFSTVEGDLPTVMRVLSYKIGDYNSFVNGLTPADLKKFAAYTTRQKNMDRVMEYVQCNLAIRMEFEDWGVNGLKLFPKLCPKIVPRKMLGNYDSPPKTWECSHKGILGIWGIPT